MKYSLLLPKSRCPIVDRAYALTSPTEADGGGGGGGGDGGGGGRGGGDGSALLISDKAGHLHLYDKVM